VCVCVFPRGSPHNGRIFDDTEIGNFFILFPGHMIFSRLPCDLVSILSGLAWLWDLDWFPNATKKVGDICIHIAIHWASFPCGSAVKDPPANAGDAGLIPGLGRFLGEGNNNPVQYSYLENPMDRRAWWATVHGVAQSQTRLSD